MPDRDQSRQWPKKPHDISVHHLARYYFASISAYGRILDAACGCGYGSLLLSEGGREVVGVDVSGEAISWANAYFPGPLFICRRIEDSPWEGQFDTVVSLETIEHVPNPAPLLEALRGACRGLFIASVPNEGVYPFKAETFANDESPHYRHYTPAQFDELLKRHGFTVLSRLSQKSKMEPEMQVNTEGKFLTYVCN